jgi:hypothetical protein
MATKPAASATTLPRPPRRIDIPPRKSENRKRALDDDVPPERIVHLLQTVKFEGSPKHKRFPHRFGLEPYRGVRGDETLCDAHAKFEPSDWPSIMPMLRRGLRAGLVGTNIWAVADNGWIYEGAVTNAVQSEYHGYPVRPSEAIASEIYRRFKLWADTHGTQLDKQAAANCAARYRLRNA